MLCVGRYTSGTWYTTREFQIVSPKVTGYEKNLHKGLKTREEAEQAHSQFLAQQSPYYLPPKHEVHGTQNIAGYSEANNLQNFIIVVLVIYIMYLLWSNACVITCNILNPNLLDGKHTNKMCKGNLSGLM
jgi:hypothetical protein